MNSKDEAAAKLVTGRRYLTTGGRPLFMLDTDANRWLLVLINTAREHRQAVEQVAKLDGPPIDGAKVIVDGAAFLASFEWEHEGRPLVLAVGAKFRGSKARHVTISKAA